MISSDCVCVFVFFSRCEFIAIISERKDCMMSMLTFTTTGIDEKLIRHSIE